MSSGPGAPEGRRLHPVRVELWCPHGPEISWLVLALRGTEALSSPYEFELDLACDDPTVEPPDNRAWSAVLAVFGNGRQRDEHEQAAKERISDH